MSTIPAKLPSNKQLLKATALAIAVAGVILVTAVLPAEYGIDPTGVGKRLGLDVLASTADAAEIEAPAAPVSSAPVTQDQQARNTAEATKAAKAFGANKGQSFAAQAYTAEAAAPKHETLSLTLAPGKGA